MVAKNPVFSYNGRVPTRPNTTCPSNANLPCLAGHAWMTHAHVFAAALHQPAAHL